MLDLVIEADPTNNKAWQRKIQNLISLGEVDQAAKTVLKAEPYAILEHDKQQIRNFKAKISQSNLKDKELSQKMFSQPLYQDKAQPAPQTAPPQAPAPNGGPDLVENQILGTLTNRQWLMYPFVKTIRVLSEKLCGKKTKRE